MPEMRAWRPLRIGAERATRWRLVRAAWWRADASAPSDGHRAV